MRTIETIGLALVLVTPLGCAGGETSGEIEPDSVTGTDETNLLARIDAPHGGSVEWFAADSKDGVEVKIVAVYPHAVPIAPDLVEEHGPLLAWLALAGEGSPIPESLASAASPGELERAADPELVARVRTLHETQQRSFGSISSALSVGTTASGLLSDCSTSFRNWVRSSYGEGFGTSSTCGDAAVEWPGWRSKDYFYCNNCEHTLGSVDKVACYPPLPDCSAVRGRQFSKVARVTGTNGDAQFISRGHRYRYAVAVCSGNNSVIMKRQATGGTVKQDYVSVGQMIIRVGNTALHSRVTAITNVTFGDWERGIDQNGALSEEYNFWITRNTTAGDAAIMCVDLQNEIQMSDISSCSSLSLCTGTNCTGSCYD